MSTNWGDAVWNERGELVVSIYKQPPEMKDNLNNKPKHTYKEIDCGGECGGCVALVVDGEVISGPPFHPNCKCSLSAADIESAPEQESNLGDTVGPNRNSAPEDVKWLKEALQDLGFYEPDARAGETPEELNQYPNQNLFNAINKFQREHNLSERGIVAPGYQTEAKINNELKKQTKTPQGHMLRVRKIFKIEMIMDRLKSIHLGLAENAVGANIGYGWNRPKKQIHTDAVVLVFMVAKSLVLRDVLT